MSRQTTFNIIVDGSYTYRGVPKECYGTYTNADNTYARMRTPAKSTGQIEVFVAEEYPEKVQGKMILSREQMLQFVELLRTDFKFKFGFVEKVKNDNFKALCYKFTLEEKDFNTFAELRLLLYLIRYTYEDNTNVLLKGALEYYDQFKEEITFWDAFQIVHFVWSQNYYPYPNGYRIFNYGVVSKYLSIEQLNTNCKTLGNITDLEELLGTTMSQRNNAIVNFRYFVLSKLDKPKDIIAEWSNIDDSLLTVNYKPLSKKVEETV